MLGHSTVHNVANGSYAWQSSVYSEWDGMLPVDFGAHRAVDGSRKTCMQTNRDDYPWLGLDLGKEYQVSYIEIDLNGKLLLRFGIFFYVQDDPWIYVHEAQGSSIRGVCLFECVRDCETSQIKKPGLPPDQGFMLKKNGYFQVFYLLFPYLIMQFDYGFTKRIEKIGGIVLKIFLRDSNFLKMG